ncbi:MAG: hypothetical protein KatS3mg023_1484 [Armatimonadota bacterium]|nr:MAG: hypothetical protein KatS3mg023_1484 [Armatimonadota bacterium]
MRVLVVLVLVMVMLTAYLTAHSEDISPQNAPESDLVAHLLAHTQNISLRLAPFTQRVWSESDLLRLCAETDTPRSEAIRRLLQGDSAPQARAAAGLALWTGEREPRLAWRVSGIYSVAPQADMVFSVDTTRSLYEQRAIMPWLYTAQLRVYTSLGEWRIGQAPLRWGGGYSGAMLLSDTAPPLFHLGYRKQWHLGKRLGTWQFEQIATVFEENGSSRYVMARRFSRALSPQWEISLAEAFKANKLPAGLSAMVLPFYLYQHLLAWRVYDGKDEWFNYIADLQVQYRFAQQRVYLDLLLDDLQAPRWLTRFRYTTPRKSGVLIGYHTPLANGGQFIAEIAHTDGNPGGGTYSYKIPENRWRYRDAVLGHPAGTNRDMLWLRADIPLGEKAYLAVEYANSRLANATPEVPVGTAWTAHLYWLLGEECTLGVCWQRNTARDGQADRWLLGIGTVF